MEITYRDTHEFTARELGRLFLSVEWSSGHFPEKLVVAMKNFRTVFSAWDGEKLIGMVREKYRDYLRIAAIAYDEELSFYRNCGFAKSEVSSPMFITSLWT